MREDQRHSERNTHLKTPWLLHAASKILLINAITALALTIKHAYTMANHQLHQVVLINQSNIACARQTLQILRHRMRKSAAGHQNTLQTAVQKHRTSKLLNLVGVTFIVPQ